MPKLFGDLFKSHDDKNAEANETACTTKILSHLSTEELITTGRLVSKSWKHFIDVTFADNINRLLLNKTMPAFFINQPNHAIAHVRALTGGLTNKSFYIKTQDGGDYVARHPGFKSSLFINRNHESHNVRVAISCGISPEVMYENSSGSRISAFLENAIPLSVEQLKHHDNIQSAARTLKIIHSAPSRFANDTNVFTRNRQMLAILRANQCSPPEEYNYLMNIMHRIESIISRLHITTVPCHNDTTPGNFIFSNGQLKMIDWEYSGNNDPIWDLANLSMEALFTPEQDNLLLQAYYDQVSADIVSRFTLYKPVVEYWVCLWSLVQMSNRNCVESMATLEEMERTRFKSCLRQLESESFKNAISALDVTETHRQSIRL